MSYKQERLDEALHVIREDTQRRNAIHAATLARTQYRDGFHLRRSTNVPAFSIATYHNDDTSDDEYDPNIKRKKRKRDDDFEEGKGGRKPNDRRKRKSLPDDLLQGDEDNFSLKPPSKKVKKNAKKGEKVSIEPTASSSFITLKLNTEAGRALLAKTQKITGGSKNGSSQDNANQSQWEAASGGLHRAHRSNVEQENDHEVAKQLRALEELDICPRILRSGKVRKALEPKKRQKEEDSEDETNVEVLFGLGEVKPPKRRKVADIDFDVEFEIANKTQNNGNQDCPIVQQPSQYETPVKNHPSCTPNKSTGKSIDDAICLDSSDDEEDNNSAISSPLNLLSRRKSSSFTTPSSSEIAQPHLAKSTPTTFNNTRNIANDNIHTSTRIEPQTRISTLETHFSHPINFKSNSAADCNFHNNYRYGIMGLGPTTGQYLISSSKPSQWTELESGHRANHPPDTMCVACALAYLRTIRCETHTCSRLQITSRQYAALTNHAQAYTTDMFDPPRRGHTLNMRALATTCSLCPAPAAWTCCQPQHEDHLRRPCALPGETIQEARMRVGLCRSFRQDSPADVDLSKIDIQPALTGCGLHLCPACYTLVQKYGGKLQANRSTIIQQVKARPLGVRADIEFRFEEGLVWKAYNVDRPDADEL